MTLAERMTITRNRATGFDYLRIILAISIVIWHSVVTCYGSAAQDAAFASPLRPVIAMILPLFFALSGFLVAGSLARTPELAKFLALRVLRIFPALVTETLLSAFILGPLLTSAPIKAYFTNYRFRHYLMNMVGDPHYQLLGVFLHNPFPSTINGQLWTVPFELQCYILLSVLAFLGIAGRRFLVFWCAVALQVALLVGHVLGAHHAIHMTDKAVEGPVLVLTFLSGVALYALREKIAYSLPLFVGCLVATLIGLATPLGDYFIPYPAAYVTVYLGLLNPKANALHKLGDLSYGIFLYGFPIQQFVASWGAWTDHWFVSLPISLALTTGFAFASWNVVEKPTLRLKNRLGFLRPIDEALETIKGAGTRGRLRLLRAYQLRQGRQGFVDRTP